MTMRCSCWGLVVEHSSLRADQTVFCTFTVTLIWVFPKCFHWIQWHKILYFKQIIRTCHLLCKRLGCYHSTSRTQVAERIFELSPIHASLIYQSPWTHWISNPLRGNSILPHVSLTNLILGWHSSCPNMFQWQNIIFKKIILTCNLLCKRPRCYHSTSTTQVTDL